MGVKSTLSRPKAQPHLSSFRAPSGLLRAKKSQQSNINYSRSPPPSSHSGRTCTRSFHVLEATHPSSPTKALPQMCNHTRDSATFHRDEAHQWVSEAAQRTVQQASPVVPSGLTLRVKSSATPDYASWGLWTKQEATWLRTRFWTKRLCAAAAQNTPRVPVWGILLGFYRNGGTNKPHLTTPDPRSYNVLGSRCHPAEARHGYSCLLGKMEMVPSG